MRAFGLAVLLALLATPPAAAHLEREACLAEGVCVALAVDGYGAGCGDGASLRWHEASASTPVQGASATAGCGSTAEGGEVRTVEISTGGLRHAGLRWHSVEDPDAGASCATTLTSQERVRELGCPVGPPPRAYPLLV